MCEMCETRCQIQDHRRYAWYCVTCRANNINNGTSVLLSPEQDLLDLYKGDTESFVISHLLREEVEHHAHRCESAAKALSVYARGGTLDFNEIIGDDDGPPTLGDGGCAMCLP